MQVAKKIIIEQLSPIYAKEEIEGLTRLIFEKVLGLSLIGIHLNQNETISAANLAQIKEIINRLVQFEPIQYIFGETEFYGSHFKVNRGGSDSPSGNRRVGRLDHQGLHPINPLPYWILVPEVAVFQLRWSKIYPALQPTAGISPRKHFLSQKKMQNLIMRR